MTSFRTAQIGVTSLRASGYLTGYTRVSDHIHWIKKIAPDAKNTKCQ